MTLLEMMNLTPNHSLSPQACAEPSSEEAESARHSQAKACRTHLA